MGSFTRGIPFIGASVRFNFEAIEDRGQRQRLLHWTSTVVRDKNG